jgi:hypothetical protein
VHSKSMPSSSTMILFIISLAIYFLMKMSNVQTPLTYLNLLEPKNALKNFDYDEEKGLFVVTAKCMLKINMIVKFVAVGVSFRQARRLYQTVKEETGMGVLGNITDKEVSNICRCHQSTILQGALEGLLGFLHWIGLWK